MERFAKLFEFEDIGQVLAVLKDGEEGPEIRYFVMPTGLGVCEIASSWEDDEEGLSLAKKTFEGIDEERARGTHAALMQAIGKSTQ